jgi:hypothetical protein
MALAEEHVANDQRISAEGDEQGSHGATDHATSRAGCPTSEVQM